MFAELLGRSCFSFLDGGSLPAEMVERAHALGLAALAIADRDGLYGMARAWAEQKKREKAGSAATRLIVGADLTLGAPFRRSRVALLVQDRDGYTNLCRLLTEAHRGRPKGEPLLDPSWLAVHPGGLVALLPSPYDPALAELAADAFGDRAFLAVHRHLVSDDRRRSDEARLLSERTGLGVVATGRPLYHDPSRRPVHDVLTCIRLGITLDDAGTRIAPNAEAFLRSEASMRHLFRDEPAWVDRTVEIASSCRFTMAELRYRFPSDELCPGETADVALARQVEEHLPWRYPDGVPAKVRAQLDKELALIARLEVAPYFLSVLAIVDLARERGILCQGRGSAANSAVCYVLGITSVDPARSSLLFERFLSAERNEPPDIDVDFEHERREEVIQEIYRRYGRDRAAMVSEVIRYRERSALREVGKAFGLSDEIASRMTGSVLWGDDASLSDERLREVGLDPRDSRVRQTMLIAAQIQGFPRHLSVHVGGFVLSSGPLSEVAPIEPARMIDRTVVQWDKDDLDVLGFFKVDVLALGMLTAIRKALEMIASGASGPSGPGRLVPEGFDAIAALAAIPPADPAVYDAFCKADTVGVFQIESRAQMSMLPNLRPRTFYDLVIEVAIVRPGPIQGGMVHPYLRRRAGKERAVSPHACLEPILDRTLGVPLFQEQVMQIAITGAGYTGGEADELRRDMAAWKRSGALERHREKLLAGFRARGIEDAFGEALFKQIQGFGEYGFPESHAASFALLVYASGYLKVHHPAAFVCALIDSQPMGFYSPSALVQDAQRHGVEVRPVRLDASDWDATLEWDGSTSAPALGGLGEPQPAVRLGMRLLRGFSRGAADRIVLARREAPFTDVDDLWRRARPNRKEMDILAEAGALAPLVPAGRREALWRARAPRAPGLFERIPIAERAPRLPPLSSAQQLSLDYEHVGLSVSDHPMRHLRPLLPQERLAKASELATMRHRSRVAVAGLVQSRQRPGTASGVVFVTLEDETGSCNIVLWARVFERYRQIAVSARVLHVKGVLEREGTVVHVIADELFRVDGGNVRTSSRDFH